MEKFIMEGPIDIKRGDNTYRAMWQKMGNWRIVVVDLIETNESILWGKYSHMESWYHITISPTFEKYKTIEEFLADYPEFRLVFLEKVEEK